MSPLRTRRKRSVTEGLREELGAPRSDANHWLAALTAEERAATPVGSEPDDIVDEAAEVDDEAKERVARVLARRRQRPS
jgi:hypothetical protein